jgi:HK97 gp10 family phage protein
MIDGLNVKTTGLSEMEALFRKVRQRIAECDDKIAGEHAQELASAIEAAAPRGETGELRVSVDAKRVVKERDRVRYRIKAGGARTRKPVKQGQSPAYDYARADEFGTKDTPSSPFFWPTHRRLKPKYRRRINAGRRKIIKGIGL